jgi:hypothetical protein
VEGQSHGLDSSTKTVFIQPVADLCFLKFNGSAKYGVAHSMAVRLGPAITGWNISLAQTCLGSSALLL